MLFKRKIDQEAAPAVDLQQEGAPVIHIGAALTAATNTVDALLATHQQIEVAFTTAKAGCDAANRDLHESNARLAVVESGAALNGDDVDRGARKAHAAARDAVEFAEARVTGLEARLIQSAAALSEAKRALAGEWTAWKNEQAEAVVAQFEKAMDGFVCELKVVKAASAVLGHAGRLDSILRGIALPDPHRPFMDHASPARLKDWPDFPAANDVNNRLADVAARVVPLIRDLVDGPVAGAGDQQVAVGFVSGLDGGI